MAKQEDMMMNPARMMEAWFKLMSEATRGSGEAREIVQSITGTSMTPDQMLRLMTRFLPAGVGASQAKAVNESLEEYWRMMGVVPRYRYLEMLDRNEQLRRQLEETEAENQRLRSSAINPMLPGEDAQKAFDMWGTMLQETMKAQQEMLRAWTSTGSSSQTSEQDTSDADSSSSSNTTK